MSEIDKYINILMDPRKTNVSQMFVDIWDRFSISPASTKYHGSFKGGLLAHTMAVVESSIDLFNICSRHKELKISLDSVIFCSLVHDIGKIGNSEQDAYVLIGDKFEHNKNLSIIEHEILSIYWLNKYGIQMSDEEMAAIYYHAGPYAEAYKKTEETELLMIIHTADNLAAKILKV
jgi:23S rRNA maturation-related 3'-5' exoribonuclease YhaM